MTKYKIKLVKKYDGFLGEVFLVVMPNLLILMFTSFVISTMPTTMAAPATFIVVVILFVLTIIFKNLIFGLLTKLYKNLGWI